MITVFVTALMAALITGAHMVSVLVGDGCGVDVGFEGVVIFEQGVSTCEGGKTVVPGYFLGAGGHQCVLSAHWHVEWPYIPLPVCALKSSLKLAGLGRTSHHPHTMHCCHHHPTMTQAPVPETLQALPLLSLTDRSVPARSRRPRKKGSFPDTHVGAIRTPTDAGLERGSSRISMVCPALSSVPVTCSRGIHPVTLRRLKTRAAWLLAGEHAGCKRAAWRWAAASNAPPREFIPPRGGYSVPSMPQAARTHATPIQPICQE